MSITLKKGIFLKEGEGTFLWAFRTLLATKMPTRVAQRLCVLANKLTEAGKPVYDHVKQMRKEYQIDTPLPETATADDHKAFLERDLEMGTELTDLADMDFEFDCEPVTLPFTLWDQTKKEFDVAPVVLVLLQDVILIT